MQINVAVTDANNIVCEVVPPQTQTITIDRGVAGNGIVSIVPVTISTFQYLRITYTNGTVQDVGPLTSTAYTATAPITIVGNTISLATVPIASGGTNATTAADAIQNLLPSYTGNGNKRLGLNSGGTALEWVADGGGTVTSVAASGGTTGLSFTGSPITSSGTLTLGGTLGIANGGTGQTTANAAFNALAPSQTGNSGKYLTTDGTDTSWATNPLGTVTSVAATVPSFLSISGSPITTSGTLAFGLSGTALPTTSGGTGLTSFTANGVVYASSTSVLTTGSALTFNGTTFATSAVGSFTGGVGISGVGNPASGASVEITYGAAGFTGVGRVMSFDRTASARTPLAFDGSYQAFLISNSESMRLTSTGLGIGTSSPSEKLTVAGGNISIGAGYKLQYSSTAYITPEDNSTGARIVTPGILSIATGGTTARATLDAAGNLGLNITPATTTYGKSFQLGTTNDHMSMLIDQPFDSNNWPISLVNNAYSSSTYGFSYYANGNASKYTQNTGQHYWFTSASGTAGNAITFTQAMTLTNSGYLLVGATSTIGGANGLVQIRGGLSLTAASAVVGGYQQIDFSAGAYTKAAIRGYSTSTSDEGELRFYTAPPGDVINQRLQISSTGNMGLGVNAFTNSLSIGSFDLANGPGFFGYNNGLNLSANAYYNSGWKYKANAYATLYDSGAGEHNWYSAPSGTAGNSITFTNSMRLTPSGNLGIGTTSPAYRLDLNTATVPATDTYTYLQLQSGNYGYILGGGLKQSAGGVLTISQNQNGSVTEYARLDASGNLLVNTTSNPNASHQIWKTNPNGIVASLQNPSSTNGFVLDLVSQSASGTGFSLIRGYVGGPTQVFAVLGNGNVQNTNNSYGAISDVKLKENIVDTTPKLADLMQVQVRNYNLIGETTKQIGVVAQELETVFPAMVEETPDRDAEGNDLGTTTKSVKYSVFVPMLIKAVQELKAEFDAYKACHP